MSIDLFYQDPSATLDYPLDWSTHFPSDPLTGSNWLASPSGIVVESDSFDNTSSTVWLSGGTLDVRYALTNRVTTQGGREDEHTIYVLIKDQ